MYRKMAPPPSDSSAARERQRSAQGRDHLIQAVRGHRHAVPRGLRQQILGEHFSRAGGQQTQKPEMPIAEQHLFTVAGQPPSFRSVTASGPRLAPPPRFRVGRV